MNPLLTHLDRALSLTHDLVESLDEAHLQLDIPDLPSNRIGEQLWCVVGARESYTKAIEQGVWAGFSCSLKEPFSKAAALACLSASRQQLLDLLADLELDDARTALLLDLHEHEIQHHGQLIRYLYANRIPFPASWHDRYTV